MRAPLAGLLLGALLLGCGYAPVRQADGIGGVRSVAIETLANDSYEAGVEYLVSDVLRREFLRRGGLRVVRDPARADLVLSGRVRRIALRGQGFSSVLLALEYELTLELDLVARRGDGSRVPIDRHVLEETERYLASADVEAQRKNRREAIRQAATVLAGRLADALHETLRP